MHSRRKANEMSTARDQQLATTFVSLADTLVADFDVLDFLGMLTERAVDLLNVDAAGVILSDQRGGWRPTAGSSEQAELIEVFAAQTQQGPCLDCVHTGAVVATGDLADESDRWPDFAPAAVSAGFRAACAVPMRLRENVIGALTLLGAAPGEIDDASVALGQALADVATIGMLQQRAIRHEEVVSEQLQATLHHRTVVEQVKGVLAETCGLDMHQAYLALRGYAHTHRRRMSDVARDVATTVLDPHDLITDTTDVSRS